MIRNLFYISLLGSFLLPTLGFGQRTLQTQMADILNEIPARDGTQRNRLAKEMTEMGAVGRDLFTAGIHAAEIGNENRVRVDVSGLGWVVCQVGNG